MGTATVTQATLVVSRDGKRAALKGLVVERVRRDRDHLYGQSVSRTETSISPADDFGASFFSGGAWDQAFRISERH